MSKQFGKLVEQARRSEVPERLQLFGDMPQCTASRAIEVDWIYVLADAQANLIEALRMTHPNEERHAKRKVRRNLATIVAACQEWAKHL